MQENLLTTRSDLSVVFFRTISSCRHLIIRTKSLIVFPFNHNAPFVQIAPFLQKHPSWEKGGDNKIEPNFLPTEKQFSLCCLPSTPSFWLVWENLRIKVSRQQMPTFALKIHKRAKTLERALCSINNVSVREAFAGRRHVATRGSGDEQQRQNEGRILGITVKWPSRNNPCRSAVLAATNAALWPGQRQIHHCSHIYITESANWSTSGAEFPNRNFKRKSSYSHLLFVLNVISFQKTNDLMETQCV